MLILKRIKDIENHLKKLKKQGLTVGFTPTMGALHPGHISLIKASKKDCDKSVCSIFINPTQFNDPADFEKYPVTIDKDIELLNDAGCDILFLPSVKEMYPEVSGLTTKGGLGGRGRPTTIESLRSVINFGYLAQTLEGEHRPGHFNGMAQIVSNLLKIVKPHKLYMGQKDYQQQLIVGQLIKKMHFNTQLVMCPTLREKDGLAMSSRNMRLDAVSRKLAVEILKTLKKAKADARTKNQESREIQGKAFAHLSSVGGIEPEYFEIRNATTLLPPKRKTEKLIALTAVKIGGVRLIDNMLLN